MTDSRDGVGKGERCRKEGKKTLKEYLKVAANGTHMGTRWEAGQVMTVRELDDVLRATKKNHLGSEPESNGNTF